MPAPVITLSDLGTAQEASAGVGVTVTENVAAPGLSSVYEAVYTASGVNESGWQQVGLDANGNGAFSVNLAHTGDYVKAVDNLDTPAVTASSSAITITDPVPPASATFSSSSRMLVSSNVAETVQSGTNSLEPPLYPDNRSSHESPNPPAHSVQDRFVLTGAQEATSYEQVPAVEYGPAGQAPSGALAEFLLQHLSHLAAETMLPQPSLALHDFLQHTIATEGFTHESASTAFESSNTSPEASTHEDNNHLIHLDSSILPYVSEHFH